MRDDLMETRDVGGWGQLASGAVGTAAALTRMVTSSECLFAIHNSFGRSGWNCKSEGKFKFMPPAKTCTEFCSPNSGAQTGSAATGGCSTASTTWITPFDAWMSASTTADTPFSSTLPELSCATVMPTPIGLSVESSERFRRSDSRSEPGSIWYSRLSASCDSVRLKKMSYSAMGMAAKASSEGTNTVYGPSLVRASTSPAAVTALVKVLNLAGCAASVSNRLMAAPERGLT